jgi:glycosyltransferase involved in cell wall biosynthesis
MVHSLAQGGHEVHVATTDDDGLGRLAVPLNAAVREDGITLWHFRRQARFYTVSWPLARWLRTHVGDYDLLHIHALFSWSTVIAAHWAWRLGVPYIIRPLGTLSRWGMTHRRRLLKRVSFRLIEHRILARAAAIHCTSQQELLETAELGTWTRIVIVPLGADLRRLECRPAYGWLARRAPHLAGRVKVLSLSRLDAIKGLDLLLVALASLAARGHELALIVAGSGQREFETALQREAKRLRFETDVVWAGFLEGAEKLAALAEADMFVLPSYSENFGVAVVEAMASGLPVVISDQVGIHREVAEAGAGLVVPCRAEPLANAIKCLAEDPGLRRELGERGRRLARERFSSEAMTAGLVQLYEETLRSARAAAC